MPASASPPAITEWVTGRRVADLLGVPIDAVARLAAQGRIGKRDLPVHARYSRADAVRLAAEQDQQTHKGA